MDKHILGATFYGNEVSEYGQKHGFVDYLTLKKAFNAILNNGIMNATANVGEWECIHGAEQNDDGMYEEVLQLYIIDKAGAEILQNWTREIVYYNSELDMYVWGVTHFGTSWDYVLTDIGCAKKLTVVRS